MAELHFITSGKMNIELTGLKFGKHIQDPRKNVKSYSTGDSHIVLNAADMKDFTDWGIIELQDLNPGTGYITVTIDSDTNFWYGTAQIAIFVNGTCILNDNFQSGVKGPVGDPKKVKRYPIGHIG